MLQSLVGSLTKRLPLCALLLCACSYSPEVPSGALRCASDGRCPAGLVCGADGLCYRAVDLPPDAPGAVGASGGAGSITVTWTAPARSGGSPISRYTVLGTSTSGGPALSATAIGTTSATFSGLGPGVGYVFNVVAVNDQGQSPASPPSPPAFTFNVPGPPQALLSVPLYRAATLDWLAPASNGGSPVTGYAVVQSLGGGASAPAAATITGTHADLTGLQAGGTYTFQVRAVNAIGNGPLSAASAPVTLPSEPPPPVITAAALVTTGDTGLTASLPARAGMTYAWVLAGATLAGSSAGVTAGGTNTITYSVTAGAGGSVTLSVTETDPAGTAGTPGTATQAVLAAPGTPAINVATLLLTGAPGTASVTITAGMAYDWTVTGGTLTSPAAGVTSGQTNTVSFNVTAAAGGTVRLQVTEVNGAGKRGIPVTRATSVGALPSQPAITAPDFVTTLQMGFAASIPAGVSGESVAWTVTGAGALVGLGTGRSITFDATDAAGAVVHLSALVSNALGSSPAGTRDALVVPTPVAPVIAADPIVTESASGRVATVTPRASMTYQWTLSGAAAAGTTTSATLNYQVTAVAPGPVTLRCVETNQAGVSSAAGVATVQVAPAPVTPAISLDAQVLASGKLTAGATGRAAAVAAPDPAMTYTWAITGGTITQTAVDTTSVTYSVPGGATPGSVVTVSAQAKNAAGALSAPGSASATVREALAVTALAPVAATVGASLDTVPSVTLSRPAANPSVTATTACGQSTLRLQVVGQAACLPLTLTVNGSALALDPGGLLPGTQYQLTALGGTGGLADDQGVAISQSSVTKFTTHGELAPAASALLQSVTIGWGEPATPGYSGGLVEYKLRSSGSYTAANAGAPLRSPVVLDGLVPGALYDLRVRAVDGAVLSPGAVLSTQLAPTGADADFPSGAAGQQRATGLSGSTFALTWSGDTLFAGVANGDLTKAGLAAADDALWLAVDTGGAGADSAGELRTLTGQSGSSTGAVLWPFKADYVIELRYTGSALAARLRTAASGTWASLDATPGVLTARALVDNTNPAFDELGVPASALPSLPATPAWRFALALVHAPAAGVGNTLDLAPKAAAGQANDVAGSCGSLTTSYAPGANAFDASKSKSALAAATSPASLAAWLVGLRLSANASAMQVLSDNEPFSSGNVFFGGTAARFNLGAATGELAFRLDDGSGPETDAAHPRIWTRSGAAETLPVITYGGSYAASNPATITFNCTAACAGAVELLGDVPELGNLTPGSGVPLCGGGACASDNVSVTVVMTHAYDFNAAPLHFQVAGAGLVCNSGGLECGALHAMAGDLLNARTLSFVAGDGKGF